MKRRASGVALGPVVGRALNIALVSGAVTYVMWVLVGTVAWISHLGERAVWLSAVLPAKGYPSREAARGTVDFARRNVPLSLVFVIPHSACLPSRMRKYFGSHGRVVYNFVSAVTLHAFLSAFTPLKTPVVMTMPFNERFHDALDRVSRVRHARVHALAREFGVVGRELGDRASRREVRKSRGWYGRHHVDGRDDVAARRRRAFVLFTGLSIIPAKLTLGDCITRCIAAIYLRQRSRSFRGWVEKIEDIHLFTWILRGLLLSFVLLRRYKETATCARRQ